MRQERYNFFILTQKHKNQNRASLKFLRVVNHAGTATLLTLWRNHSTPDAAEWKRVAIARAFERKGLPVPE